ncbi:MAG: hypothetical protein NDI62_00770 [Burkholderiales bacterium]|nr:hypothetical protein [Burkholderiales bacterium]
MKNIYEQIKKILKEIFEKKVSNAFLITLGLIITAILIFSAGVSVGFRKASFGRAWGENYERNFGMRPNKMMFEKDNFPNSHGAIGKILKIELPNIIVQDKDNTEKIILVKEDTKIQKMMSEIKSTDLLINDFIVTIGSPNEEGQIEAKLIRVMPSPELMPGFRNIK